MPRLSVLLAAATVFASTALPGVALAQDTPIALDIPAQFPINFPIVSPSACWQVAQPPDGRITATVTGGGEWNVCILDTGCPMDCMDNGRRSASTERLRAGRFYFVKVETRSPGVTATLTIYPTAGGAPGGAVVAPGGGVGAGGAGGAVAGLWDTNLDSPHDPLTLTQVGSTVTGVRNTPENGELVGTLTGNVLDGFWIEDMSAQRCTTARNGRFYWGRVQMTFSGDTFEGKWGYCDSELAGTWKGTRSGVAGVSGLWDSNLEGPLTLVQEGSTVTGTHNTAENGEVVGILSGNVLDGFWIEDMSAQRCATARNGRFYWGRIQMTFNGDRFDGKWGYCDGDLTGTFQGSRKSPAE
jgi:hypothetical protein